MDAGEHPFWPDTVSTNLHRYSVDEPWLVTLPFVMSKMLLLGMSLSDVVAKTTVAMRRLYDIDRFVFGPALPGQ